MKRLVSLLLATLLAGAGGSALAQGAPPAGAGPQGGPPQGGPPQQAGQIRGTVLDAQSGSPVGSASVSVWSAADSVLVTGAVARPDGTFRIEGLRPGRYYVRVSFLGYTTASTAAVAVTPAAPQADVGTVRLAASAVALQGLEVTAERAAVAMAPDRNTYSAKDLPSSAGGTAADVLRNVPAIEVDADGKPSLRGNENVAVQINGRAAPVRGDQIGNFLRQLPAGMVERVEVVPNPSAKYEPDGMAGIVNIVLKQNADLGTSGGITAGLGTGGKYNASGNLGWQRGALTLFGNYGFQREEREMSGFSTVENRFLNPATFLEQDVLGDMEMSSHTLNGTGELKLGKENVLSTSALATVRDFGNGITNLYRQLDAGQALTGRYNRISAGDNRDFTFDYSLAFKRTLAPQRHELSAELRYNRSDLSLENRFRQELLTLGGDPSAELPALTGNDLDALASTFTGQLDYTHPLGERGKLETGFRGTLRRLDNDFAASEFSYDAGAWIPDAAQTNAFRFDEQVNAGYAVLSQGVGRFDLQAGLRLEHAATDFDLATTGEAFEHDYTSLFPSALAAWNVTDSRQLKASYSRRIQRPDTRLLNPFKVYQDPQNVFLGNPELDPEYTDSYELGFQQSWPKGSLQATPYYRRTTGAIRPVKTVDAANVTTTTFENFATAESYGADFTGSMRLGDRLSGFASFNLFRMVNDAGDGDAGLDSDALGWSTRLNASFKVTPRLDLQGFWMYRAPMDVVQGRIGAFSMANFSVRQKLMGEKASLSLRVVDPFETMRFSQRTADARHAQEVERRFGARAVYLTFSYNVGQAPRLRPRPQDQQQPAGDPTQPVPVP